MRLIPLAICSVVGVLGLQSALPAADLRFFDDAALHDVQFIDEKEGWAVGDDGVVLHTIDGGKTWERQPTGVRASLRSVHFLKNNPYFGWIAGRVEMSYGQGSVGVLLRTTDGGVRWTQLLENSLPGLNRVVFVDPKTGYVFGDGSDQFPTGLFKTVDGGRTWEAVKGPRAASWSAGAFSDADTGFLVGSWSRMGIVRPDGFGATALNPLDGRNITDVHVLGQRALAVAQGGLVLTSTSQGGSWGIVDVKLPTPVRACLDFRGIHGVGKSVWIVGRPGTVVLHTKDADSASNAAWQLLPTGQSVPLNAVHFSSENIGWAVGDMGTILHTGDGGKTWKTQRHGGRRTTVLCVHSSASAVPLDTISLLGADQGYHVAALRVLSPDPATVSAQEASAGLRLSAAVRQCGGAAAETFWQFPLPQHLRHSAKKDLIHYWDQLHEGKAPEHFLRQLVLALRMWQPSVVITDDPNSDESPAALTGEALGQAAVMAADAKAFPEHIDTLGLKPWRPAQVFHPVTDRAQAHVTINCQEVRTTLESSVRDFALTSSLLLAERVQMSPDERYYRVIDPGTKAPSTLLDGVLAGEDGRRQAQAAQEPRDDLKTIIGSRRTLEMLAHRALRGDPGDAAKAMAQLAPMLEKLPEQHGAPAAFFIASEFVRAGQWALAREAFLMMVDRYPAHPLSADAYRWLILHNSSSEARRRHEQEHFLQVASTNLSEAEAKSLIKVSGADKDGKGVVNAGGLGKAASLHGQLETRQWHHGGLKISSRLFALGPVYGFDPTLQFSLQSSRRQLGEIDKAQDWYGKFHNYYPGGVWHDAAAGEIWLLNRSVQPRKNIAECRLAETPPYLDGKFDDVCWQNRKPLAFSNIIAHQRGAATEPAESLHAEYPTEAWFAYDKQFVYIALRCGHPASQYVPRETARKRDEDLRPYDRVSIMLDLDRDYATYFHLQVDQRGCAREECWDDLSWNPRWFVAAASDEKGWNIEAAIPMSEFTLAGVPLGSAWACNVVRTVPGRGVLAWSHPANVEPRPEGMSLLLFQRGIEKK